MQNICHCHSLLSQVLLNNIIINSMFSKQHLSDGSSHCEVKSIVQCRVDFNLKRTIYNIDFGLDLGI